MEIPTELQIRLKRALNERRKEVDTHAKGLEILLAKGLVREDEQITEEEIGVRLNAMRQRKRDAEEAAKGVSVDMRGHRVAPYTRESYMLYRNAFLPVPERDDAAYQTCDGCGQSIEYELDTKDDFNLVATVRDDYSRIRMGGPESAIPQMYDKHQVCPAQDIKTLIFDLEIPSGLMIVGNDLRRLFPAAPIPGDMPYCADLCTTLGIVHETRRYEQGKMAFGYVGNSSPGIYRVLDRTDTFLVANISDRRKESASHDSDLARPGNVEKVAGIGTELWWYSIVDGGEFMCRFDASDVHPRIQTVNVSPGTYRFTHHVISPDFRDSGQCVYSRIERISESQQGDIG